MEIKAKPGWRDLEIGFAISEPGTARDYKTGDWRSIRPVVDRERCIGCGVCYIFCPDMAIKIPKETKCFEVDLYYCKGCGICAEECIAGCLTMVQEEE